MLFCFGFSWPFAIAKTIRAKRVDGKSPLFEIIVIVGYLFGIASHLISDRSWVIWVYLADTALVATDLSLYFHYAQRSRGSATLPAVATERDPPVKIILEDIHHGKHLHRPLAAQEVPARRTRATAA